MHRNITRADAKGIRPRYDVPNMYSRALAFVVCLVVMAAAVALSFEPVVTKEVFAHIDTEPVEPVFTTPKNVSAAAYIIFNAETGKLIALHNEEAVLPIASVTKLFTAATLLESEDLEDEITITWSDLNAEGRAGKLAYGDVYTERELLWPLLLESSNDAAAALERTEPSLIKNMNEMVHKLGVESTSFADASGLSPQNVSTAKELATLTEYLYKNEPHLFDMTQLPQYIGDKTGWINNNPFADDPNYIGGKHGFTYEANRTGIFLFKENEDIIGYIVLGSDDLKADINELRQ